MPAPVTVGVDIGGTKVLAGVVDDDGTVVRTARRTTPGRRVRVREVEDALVEAVLEAAGDDELGAVGIAAAGFVDSAGERVMFAPHLPWQGEPLRDLLEARLGCPVVLDNDANCAARAEAHHGAAQGAASALMITMGTGIGGALLLGGRVLRGANGMAGEFGHIQVVPDGHRCECGNRGCWEQYASGNALVRDASELVRAGSPLAHRLDEMVGGDVRALTGPLVTQAAREGDPLAIQLIGEIGAWLGVGLAGMAAAFDPSCIIVGGGVSEAGELLLAPARAEFSRTLTGRGHRLEPPIVAAELGPDAGFIGAADMARSAARRARRMKRRRRERPLRRRRSALPEA